MSHHRMAVIVIAVAVVLDAAAGLVFAAAEHVSAGLGLYWAVTTATTVGYGDVTPRTAGGHVIAVAVMLTIVPLFAATFSLFTSGLSAIHIRGIHARLDGMDAEPLPVPASDEQLAKLSQDVSELADAVRAAMLAGPRPGGFAK